GPRRLSHDTRPAPARRLLDRQLAARHPARLPPQGGGVRVLALGDEPRDDAPLGARRQPADAREPLRRPTARRALSSPSRSVPGAGHLAPAPALAGLERNRKHTRHLLVLGELTLLFRARRSGRGQS